MTFSLTFLRSMVPPPRFIATIKKCYQDLTIVLKIKKEVIKLPQTVGVRQGNNMAPVLFLFLMSAFTKTLETEWRITGIDIRNVHLVTGLDLAACKGIIRGHLPKEYLSRTLTAIYILQCLYIDNGAFNFSS
jgi:hypothetical protein